MGVKQSSTQFEKKSYISPIPGTFGATAARKNHITVYNDKTFLYVPIKPQMFVLDVKQWLAAQNCRDIRLYYKERQLRDESKLQDLGLDDTCMLRAVSIDSIKTDEGSQESQAKLSTSTVSIKSCPVKDSSFSSNHDSLCSLPVKGSLWDIDFSIYAVPEAGRLTNKIKRVKDKSVTEVAVAAD